MKEYIKPNIQEVIVGIKSQMLQSSDPGAFDEPSTNPSYGKRKGVFVEEEDEGDYGW